MKHILYIYHTSTIGGGSYCLLNILKELDKTQYKASVLLAGDGPLVNEIRNLGIDVYFFRYICSVPYNSTLFTPKRLLNLFLLQLHFKDYVQVVQKIHPDIVYVNSMMLYPFLFIKKYYLCKTVIHIREHWPVGEHIKQRAYAERCINQYADQVIAINQFSASMFDSLSKKSSVVYDWIDLSARDENIDMDEIFGEDTSQLKIFIYTGGYVSIKGLLDILIVFKYVKNANIRLLILGIPPQETYSGFRKLKRIMMDLRHQKSYIEQVNELMLCDRRIKCVERTYYIKQYLEKASCMLSFFKIPHANLAMAECLISGTPVIAADTEEAREYSSGGQAAMLFSFNSPSAFKSAILDYLSHPNEAKDNTLEYRQTIQQLFDSRRNALVLDGIYKKL